MKSTKARQYIRAHVLGLVAIFVALSGTAIAGGGDPTASSSVVTDAKFKKLKKRVAAVEAKLNSPVSGDLTGTLPNLQIAANAVTTNELANNAVTNAKVADNAINTAKVADNAVTTAKIADGQITGAKLGTTTIVPSPTTNDVGGAAQLATCTAPSRMLSGGGLWGGTINANVWLNGSLPGSASQWQAQGNNATGVARNFNAFALCLN